MAASDKAYTTGVDKQEGLRRRDVSTPQPNGTSRTIEVDEKTKQKVSFSVTQLQMPY